MVNQMLYGHPRGWVNPVTMRADAALTAAWVASGTTNVAYATGLSFSFTYERGAASGAVDWQIEVSIYSIANDVPAGMSEWITESIYASGAVPGGADVASLVQREYQVYQSTGAGDEDWVYALELPTPIERVRISVRESADHGVPGTPGNFSAAMLVR